MSQEKIEAFVFEIKDDSFDAIPEVVLIIQDTIIHSGTWLTSVDVFIEGILKGLELADYSIDKKNIKIEEKELKATYNKQDLLKHV